MLINKSEFKKCKENLKNNCSLLNSYLEKKLLSITGFQTLVINKQVVAKLLRLDNCERVFFQQNLFSLAEDIKNKEFNKKYSQVVLANAAKYYEDLQAYLQGKSLQRYHLIFQLACYFLDRRIKVIQSDKNQLNIKKQIFGKKESKKALLVFYENKFFILEKDQQKKFQDDRLTDQSENESYKQEYFVKNFKNRKNFTDFSLSFNSKQSHTDFEELQKLNSVLFQDYIFQNTSQNPFQYKSKPQNFFNEQNSLSQTDSGLNLDTSSLSKYSKQDSFFQKNNKQNFLIAKLKYYNRKTKRGLIVAKNNLKFKLTENQLIEKLRKKNNIFFRLIPKVNEQTQDKVGLLVEELFLHEIKPKDAQLII